MRNPLDYGVNLTRLRKQRFKRSPDTDTAQYPLSEGIQFERVIKAYSDQLDRCIFKASLTDMSSSF